ncbi:MAG: sterol desaturase family protein [Chloroflexaceae bacterium]|nr:sterol desaturase family protein [Chloroflexaceae bacterium]
MQILLSVLLAFLVCSFLEYWIHRLMHHWSWFGRITKHQKHHSHNTGAGVFVELGNYCAIVPFVTIPAFLVAPAMGIGVLVGSLLYVAFAAYAHQLQHDNPTKCFWLKMPLHYVHHGQNQWHYNYGLVIDWWDYVFGTYKPADWLTPELSNQPHRHYWQLKWR